YHSNPHIEGPIHLAIRHPADSLKQAENRQHWPGRAIQLGSGPVGEDSGNVLEQAAAGDVCQALNEPRAEQAIKRAQVASMGLEQLAGHGRAKIIDLEVCRISRNLE